MSESFIGQLAPYSEIPTDRPPELCLTIALYIEENGRQDVNGAPLGDIAIHFAPLERLTPDSPPALNQHPSNFDVWAALKAMCDVISTYDEETRERIRDMAAYSKRMAFEQQLLASESSQLAENIRKANLAGQVRQDILNDEAEKALRMKKRIRRN